MLGVRRVDGTVGLGCRAGDARVALIAGNEVVATVGAIPGLSANEMIGVAVGLKSGAGFDKSIAGGMSVDGFCTGSTAVSRSLFDANAGFSTVDFSDVTDAIRRCGTTL